MELINYILAGAGVGFAIGLTGIGGGSLMTPLLIMFGIPFATAIGTDLLYAAITKVNSAYLHHQKKNINWRIVFMMGLGSIPSAMITAYILKTYFEDSNAYQHILTLSLGVMLILTSFVLFFRSKIQARFSSKTSKDSTTSKQNFFSKYSDLITFLSGIFLGVFVTLSSVGAGAFGTAILIMLYPKLKAINIIGTDLAHAVPLTLIAGLGHMLFLGNVDFKLLTSLLIGSLPAVYVGTKLTGIIPETYLRFILACLLLGIGIKFTLFNF